MDRATRICRICGREYPYCKTDKIVWQDGIIFRWQDVACCQEHGNEFLAEIKRLRGIQASDNDAARQSEPEAEASEIEDDDYEDEDFFDDDEDFFDDDDEDEDDI